MEQEGIEMETSKRFMCKDWKIDELEWQKRFNTLYHSCRMM
jgi:hypothetical protein